MSNLSELLPAGAGAKSATFVASGTLPSGQAVALKTNGQVEAISVGGGSPSAVSGVVFESASVLYTNSATYDSTNNKVAIGYTDVGNSNYGTAVLGTVSGSTITFGTPVVFQASSTAYIALTFDSTNNKIVIAYTDYGNSDYPKVIVGYWDGAQLSFGTAVVLYSNTGYYLANTYDSSTGRVFVAFSSAAQSYAGRGGAGTVSGTSITFAAGTEAVGTNLSYSSLTFDSSLNKTILSFTDKSNSNYGTSCVVTLSGASNNQISYGAKTVFSANSSVTDISSTFDSNSNKVVIAYLDTGNSNYGKAVVGTASGTTISFGSPVTFNAYGTGWPSAVFDTNTNKVVLAYSDVGNSANNYGTVVNGTVSGTSLSFSSPLVFEAANTNYIGTAFDSTTNQVIIPFQDGGNSDYGTAAVYTAAGSNNTDFIGITDEAISSAASGSVIVQGGVITNTGLIPLAPNLGTAVAASSANNPYVSSAFDANSNKVVISYRDAGDADKGTAIVGTVSGTTISFGTPVVYSTDMSVNSTVFDSNSNKIVIAYRHNGNSNYGTAIVGTVSGTSISFGTPVVFETADSGSISATFDSNANKVVISYDDNGNSSYATSIVGTVSGTSISFGTAVVFSSKNTEYITSTFDSSNNKVVLAYAASDNTNGVRVGTVSGSAISFGTELAFHAASQASYLSSTFDTTNNKVVLFFSVGGANSGEAVVGTVSGTNITLGTQVRVGNSTSTTQCGVCFDSSQNKIMLAYKGTVSGSPLGRLAIGTVSGTSITVADATTFNAVTVAYCSPVYDSNANRTVIVYQTGTAPYPATGQVVNLTADLTIGTDYFVQSDGTISTTSSTVPAGRALSTTSMLLEG